MAQKGLCSVALENETPGAAVQLSRQEQVHDGRFDVFLVVLICVKWLLEFRWHIVYKDEGEILTGFL